MTVLHSFLSNKFRPVARVLSVHFNSINYSGKAAEICLRGDQPAIWCHITQYRTARGPIYSVWSKVKQLRAHVLLQQWYCVNFCVCVCVYVCVCVCIVALQSKPILLLFALCTLELFCVLKLSSSQVVLLLFTLINFTLQHY
jgi:hypothetical protein